MRVVICGGGVTGACIAYFLQRRGVHVTVVECNEVAGAASGKAGGFVALDWCGGSPLDALARHGWPRSLMFPHGGNQMSLAIAAGFGLGGAMPSFISLGSEYVAKPRRAAVVSLLWAGFPLGGVIGGILGSWIIPAYGWQSIFIVGGVVPIVLAVVLALVLPKASQFPGPHWMALRVAEEGTQQQP